MESILVIAIILAALYGLCVSRHVIQSIVFLNVLEAAVILAFLGLAYRPDGVPPIGTTDPATTVDPLPQALMITTIVIGAGVTALALMMGRRIHESFETLSWRELLERED